MRLNPSAHRETSQTQTGQEERGLSAERNDKSRNDGGYIAQSF
jgi:hypothetical protein